MSKSKLGFLKDARVKAAAVLSALGISGVAFAMNQDSCTFTVNTTPVDAGVPSVPGMQSEIPGGPGMEAPPDPEAQLLEQSIEP